MTCWTFARGRVPGGHRALRCCCVLSIALLLAGTAHAQTAAISGQVTPSQATQPQATQAQAASEWIRPSGPGQPLTWGRRDGVIFGLSSDGGIKGPRGLIRIGVVEPGKAQPDLLNFIAVEPVVSGPGRRFDRLAFSELEMSQLDPGERGKRMTVHTGSGGDAWPVSGKLETVHAGNATVERLSVRIDVERFAANGAHVYVIASIDSDQPWELRLTPYAEADSAPLEENTLTATMGNYERLRLLWLKDRVIQSTVLFADYDGTAFTEKFSYALPEMLRTDDGGAIVFCSSDETSPAASEGNATAHWVYPLSKYTQYWRVDGADVEPDLRVRVNARRVYWNSTAPLPGGIAFENFEVRQRYRSGGSFIFGLTQREPWQFFTGSTPLKPWPGSRSDAGQGLKSEEH